VLTQARETRFSAMKELCSELQLPDSCTFKELVPQLPSDYRPLVSALIEENNELLQRIHQRARQNHVLLTRTVESMQSVINSLGVHRPTPVYNDEGSLFVPAPSRSAIYEAVC
jgi:flagellar biosynthesis/type III secretory pathway chaperone